VPAEALLEGVAADPVPPGADVVDEELDQGVQVAG